MFREIQDHGIQIFVPDLFEDDEASNTEVKEIRTGIPFAVVGSNTLLEVNGKKVRGRIYPWGVVEGRVCSVVCICTQCVFVYHIFIMCLLFLVYK